MNINLSIVIPTKDREEDLLKCVESIKNQSAKPTEVLVVDDGQITEITKEKIKQILFEKAILFRYFKKTTPSSSESRNLGAKESSGNIILFLDDDIVLESEYIENLLKVWQEKWNDKKLAGVSGVITNVKKKSFARIVFEKVFCLYSKKTWSILPWGFQTNDFNMVKEELADWVPGGIASFRKEIFYTYKFQPLQAGRVALEDFEFCWQLKDAGYYFHITPFAKSIHNISPSNRESIFLSSFKDGLDRKIIFKIHAKKNIKNYLCFYWVALGCVLASFLGGHFTRGFGMIKGYLHND